MPRNPGARKHQHNSRHENGLVGPGKRVTKQKSNGHLNGSAKGPVPSEPLPTTGTSDQSVTVPAPETSSAAPVDPSPDTSRSPSQAGLKSRDSESSYEGQVQDHANKWESANGPTMPTHRRSDAFPTKSKASQDVSAFQIASTILRSRPACDTIALLIVLLALPSMVLTVVQALFASLTLMPGAGISPISFLSLFDVFQGSAGSPSLGTMTVVDLICLGLWICLGNWAQNFALDLAQIQIAITLGNGSSGKNGSVNAFCFAIVLFLHSIRSKGVRRFLVSNLIPTSLLSQTRFAELTQYLPSDADFGESPGPASKIRSLFAVHIISQALMAFVRRQVASSQAGASTKSTKRIDTEASAGAAGVEGQLADSQANTGTSSGVDYQPPPTPGLRDSKDKGLNAKKRRRQANHVRSRQPFWAALASTKVHVLREVEHNQGLPNATNNQSVPFDTSQQDIVWVTHVDPSSIQFEANYTPPEQDHESAVPTDSNPFFVRINGARWHSVALEPMDDEIRADGTQAQWTGEISGLAPNCTYTCTFIRTEYDEEFASVMVKTPVLLDKDLPPSFSPAPVRQSTRPSSPSTTLKNSIATAEARLSDARKRLAQVKRQHKASLNKVDREVDALNSRLKSSGDDTKLRQKLLQTERNMRQTEDSTNSIRFALDNLETVPEDDTVEYTSRKEAFEEQKRHLSDASETLLNARSSAESDMSCINSELHAIIARKDRLTSRQTKLTEQHDRITQANAQGLNEKERKAAESVAREADQLRRETDLQSHINYLANELRDVQIRTHTSWREIDAWEKQDLSQRQKLLMSSGPLTPEGELPGTRTQSQVSRPVGFGSFHNMATTTMPPEPHGSPFLAYAKTLPSETHRRPRSDTNRSLGGTSNFSADFEDADPIPPMPSTLDYDLDSRKGSGSSRGKNNCSPTAGVIGGNLRSPQRGTHSPGHLPGSTTW